MRAGSATVTQSPQVRVFLTYRGMTKIIVVKRRNDRVKLDLNYVESIGDEPDILENCGISKHQVHRLRCLGFERLSDFAGKSDLDILRLPNTNRRTVSEIREAQARRENSALG